MTGVVGRSGGRIDQRPAAAVRRVRSDQTRRSSARARALPSDYGNRSPAATVFGAFFPVGIVVAYVVCLLFPIVFATILFGRRRFLRTLFYRFLFPRLFISFFCTETCNGTHYVEHNSKRLYARFFFVISRSQYLTYVFQLRKVIFRRE